MFEDLFERLGIGPINSGVSCGDGGGATGALRIRSTNPATGEALPGVQAASMSDYERIVERADRICDLAGGAAAAARRGRAAAW